MKRKITKQVGGSAEDLKLLEEREDEKRQRFLGFVIGGEGSVITYLGN